MLQFWGRKTSGTNNMGYAGKIIAICFKKEQSGAR
jgi:hypothetical protein